MAFSETLAQKVRETLYPLTAVEEKKMFGGIAFMVNGNMTLGVIGDGLIVRAGLPNFESALNQPGANLFQPTGRPMTGWVIVSSEGYQPAEKLTYWIDLALKFVKTLPAK